MGKARTKGEQSQATAAPPAPRRLRLPLASAADVQRELARLYREARARKLDVADASRMANMLQILVNVIKGSDHEARIAVLEERDVAA